MASGADLPKEAYAQLLNYTIGVPPPNVIPDLAHPKYHGRPVNVVACVFLPLVSFFAAVRFYAKWKLIRRWTLDDYMFMISFPAGIAVLGLIIAVENGGAFGYHSWEVRMGQLTKPILMRSYVQEVISGPVIWMIKLTLFSLILTAFNPVTWLRRTIYVASIVTGLFYISCAVINGKLCAPKDGNDQLSWIAGMSSKQCADVTGLVETYSVVQGAFNVVSDFFIFSLPLPIVAKLNVSRKRKLGIYVIFLTGFIGCIMSILGLYYRRRTWGTRDVMVDTVPLNAVSFVEISVGLIVPCMISSARVVRHSYGSVMSRISTRFGHSESNTAYVELEEKAKRQVPDQWRHWDNGTNFSTLNSQIGAEHAASVALDFGAEHAPGAEMAAKPASGAE